MARNSVISSSPRIPCIALCCGLLFITSLHMVTATPYPVLLAEEGDSDFGIYESWLTDECHSECDKVNGIYSSEESNDLVYCVVDKDKFDKHKCSYYCSKKCGKREFFYKELDFENVLCACRKSKK